MDRIKLLSAFQVLALPEGAYGVTHERARDVISELTGIRPVDKPPPVGRTLEQYIEWLREQDEPVARWKGQCWWGRTCCGQSIELDGTFQAISRSID
jgi:hypothetical protein